MANSRSHGSDLPIRTEQHLDCSRGIDKSPAPHMVRICQSEPSSTLVARGGLSNPPHLTGSDLPIRTERHPGCSRGIVKSPAPYMLRICQSEPSDTLVARGGLANPPHLTWFGFVNPNRATPWLLAGD
ncbi:hypothetical protein QUF80_05545 [Desulfococcaceae bacterium HSG8]|nr:hypothetical protein [Desulfococcaceae bacterium HSG8]